MTIHVLDVYRCSRGFVVRRFFSLLLSAATGAVAFAMPAGAAPSLPGRAPATDPTVGAAAERATESSAWTLARQTGARVAVADKRTETEEVFANPDGTFTMVQNALPVRVKQGNRWAPVDATLRVYRDGTVRPVATTVPVVLSGGGSTPLARVGWRGTEFAMSWPGTLPAPVLVGDTATYRNVLPDVDLVVTVDSLGFSEVVVVKTPAAAKHKELATLRLPTSTVGLTQKVDKAGNISHVDAAGSTVFQAGTPLMWDSSTGDVGARGFAATSNPGRHATMRTTAAADGLAITPDQGMLTDPGTKFPVYLDPSVRFTGSRLAWTSVWKAYPNSKYFNSTDIARVGHENDSGMTNRSFFRMDTSTVKGKQIVAATFRTFENHAWSCGARNVEVWRTGAINANTTWNAQPSWIAKLQTLNVAKGYNSSCPDGNVDFNVLAGVQTSAAANANDLTLGLRATSETDTFAWKKFANNPTLIVDYNTAPAVPTNPTIDPGLPCVTGANRPSIQNLTPTLRATVADTTATTARFEWWVTGGSKISEAAVTVSGSAASTTVPAGTFVNGGTYSWRVRSENTLGQSAFTSFCELTVDQSAPIDTPRVTSTTYPQTPQGSEPVYRGGVGVPGSFTFTPGAGDSDVTSYVYGLNEFPPSTVVTGTGTPATATVSVTPTVEGLNTLYVRARDAGGNLGPIFGYQFYVRLATMPLGHWKLDETSGTTAADASGSNVTASATGPVSWTAGRIGGAARFAGTTGSLGTAQAPIRTNASFTVAAWVKLDHGSGSFTAVSQDGTRQSGYYLRYDNTIDRWVFGMASTDTDTEVLRQAVSLAAPRYQVWTHLAGVYDSAGGQLSLYVDGQLQGTSLHSSIWTAGGGLQIGRGLYRGAQVGWWPGDLDDVRVYQTVLPTSAIANLAAATATAAGYWKLDETSGTVAADSSGSGRPLTASGCTWGTGWVGGSLVANGACTAASAGPVVRTDQSFTVAAWVSYSGGSTNATILSQDGVTNSGFYLQYLAAENHWAFTLPNSDSSFETLVTARSSQPASANVWTHVAGVYDASAQQLRLYVDGVLVAIASHSGAWHADGPMRIGRGKWHGGNTDWWRGDVDDARAFQGALTDDQIFQLIAP